MSFAVATIIRMMITYRYRLLPNRRQHRALERILEAQRQLYNGALEERIGAYRLAGITRQYIDQTRALTEWRQSDPEAGLLPVSLQRWTLKRLDDAYQGFFRRVKSGHKPGFPRFRGKGRFDSFGFCQFSGIHLHDGAVQFKGMPGRLRMHVHRPLPQGSPIKACVFRRDVKGWSIGLSIQVQEGPTRRGNRAVGVDLGIARFAVLSDGGFIPSLRSARKTERSSRLRQRALARKQRGSRGYRKARVALARIQAAAARSRANHLHQASARLVRDYDRIVVEKLNVQGLSRSALAKDVHDASWAKFIFMLRYKAECAGARVVEVDSFDTTQECSRCGTRVNKTLKDRVHECPDCSLVMDRDLNAARNILNRAGVGPGLHNVAVDGMRAGMNLDWTTGAIPLPS